MKIKVKDLEPNPFRKIKQYPIDREKVEALKTSIKEKTFWDNILVRLHSTRKGKYQLAYGHHRHIALIELGIKEINAPVRDIDDATMVKIMAEENLNWSTSPKVMIQTILTAKDFLDAELKKHKTWEGSGEITRPLFSEEGGFQKAKKEGVGRDSLVKFLGGNWTDYKVRTALEIIKDESVDQAAAQTIPSMEQARVFRDSVKKHKIPKPTQKIIAKTIAKEGVGKRDIPDLVAEHSLLPVRKARPEPKPLVRLDDYINDATRTMESLYDMLIPIKDLTAKELMEGLERPVVLCDFGMIVEEVFGILKQILNKGLKDEKEKEEKTKKISSRQSV